MSTKPGSKAGSGSGGKSGKGAAQLLGKSGAAGAGLGKNSPFPSASSELSVTKNTKKLNAHGNAQGPPAATKHPGKPETRRPTGRAVSGS